MKLSTNESRASMVLDQWEWRTLILTEECRHKDVGGRPQPQPVGQAPHHQAGDGQHGEGRVGEAQAHRHHGQGGQEEEQGHDVLTVISGL